MIATHAHYTIYRIFLFTSLFMVLMLFLSTLKSIVIYKSFFVCEYELEITKQKQKLCHREREKI